ncbi:MAG: hypothetical protein IPN76_21970 [Saprospiraceae bacterium]|nr:hypothetical protein [Saprospiraceae bacterium]
MDKNRPNGPKQVKNVIISSDVIAEGNIHVGDVNNYFGNPEPFTPSVLPFDRPAPHIPRRIFKEKDAGNTGLFGGRESYDLLSELDKHTSIVLLGDAGMGKSIELKWFCHELKDSGIWIPIFKPLGGKKYLTDLPHLPKHIADKIVLVLDGLDESNLLEAKVAIENFRNDHPTAKILVSCRGNAYADSLPNFEVFHLGKLAYPQIREYVQEQLGLFSEAFLQYWNNKHHWNQNQLIDNPFFLVHICEYVKDKGNKIPDSLGEVFEHLIEKSFDARLPILSHFGEGDVEETRKNYRQLLEKLAFVMECMGDNVIGKEELARLIPDKPQRDDLIGKSSLLELSDNNWRFAHNNFQEYLAAKALSRAQSLEAIKKAIATKPGYQRLKWTWVNALSFLLGLWEEGNLMKSQLIDWLAKEDLAPLIKIISLEKERMSPNDRERIFRAEFEKCKKEGLIVGSHHYRYWDMAAFGESPETVRYLMEELRAAKTPNVKGNILTLLSAIQPRFVFGETKVSLKALLLQNIYDLEGNTPENRHFAMEALFQLVGNLSEEEAVKMVETFFDAEHALERSSAYRLIEIQNLQVQFMERLINRIDELDNGWGRGTTRYVNEDIQIERCLENMNTENEIVIAIEKFPGTIKNEYEDKQKPFNILLKKLDSTPVSKKGAKRIFKAIKERLSYCLSHHPYEVDKEAILNFLNKYKLGFEYFKHCVDKNPTWGKWLSLGFLDEKGIEYVVKKFSQGGFDRNWVEDYQMWIGRDKKELLLLLNQRLNEVVDVPFPMPEFKPLINHEQRRREKLIAEKSLYFNLEKYTAIIADMFDYYGKEKFKKKEIYEAKSTKRRQDEYRDDYDRYPTQLIWRIDDNPNKTKDELTEIIKKYWEWVSISSIQKFVQNHQQDIEKDPNLGLNEEEIIYVKNWCDKHRRTKIDWNGQHTYADVVFVWFVTHFHFTHYPADTYLQMVGSGLQNHGVQANVLEFVEQYKPDISLQLRERVLDNIRSGKAQGYELHLHFDFVKKHQFTEALFDLHPLIEGTGGYSNEALRVYISLGGDNDYLLDLLKRVTPSPEDYRESTLLDHFSAKQNKQFEKILLQKLATSTEPEHQLTYARYLVRQGNLVGLQFLADYIEREKKSPFSAHVGNRDVFFENPMGITILLRFYDYGCDPFIPQDSFDSLLSIGRSMLLHLAACQGRRYFEIVRDAVAEYLDAHSNLNEVAEKQNEWLRVANPEALKRLRYLLNDLDFNHYQKQPVGIGEAVETWEKLS